VGGEGEGGGGGGGEGWGEEGEEQGKEGGAHGCVVADGGVLGANRRPALCSLR